MEEKTDNIDILEEKEKIKDKLFPLAHINGYINLYEQKEARIYTSKLSEWQSATKDSLNLIETLIAKNKELKEKIKEINEEYNAEQKHEMENTIPKSKVEELIEEVKEDENPSISSFQEYAQEYAIDKLQSLLGKE